MRITARSARPADSDHLEVLRSRATAEIVEQRGGSLLVRAELGDIDSGARATSGRLCAVVEMDDVVVGFLEAALIPVDGGRCVCRVGAIYVEPEARDVGAGEALMDLAKGWARENRAEGIDVLALPGAREVKNFFETAGFAGRLIVMHHRLDSG
jgi:GNAT superfamily N-acetyltransferase